MNQNNKQGTSPVPPVAGVVPAAAFAHQQQQQPRHQPLAPRTAPLSQYPTFVNNATPPFFQNMNKRRGKWTAEEEEYATFIVQEFEKGTLKEAEAGGTLRSFLSRKLHCQPMRISKKYAGKSIGKLVFLQKSDTDEATLNAVDAKLRDLEAKFYKSLYDEIHPSQRFQAMTAQMQAPLVNGGGAYMPPQPFMMATQSGLPMPMVLPANASSSAVPQPIVVPHTAVPPPSNSAANSNVHTKNLQQTYLNALNQMIESNGQQAVAAANQNAAASTNGTVPVGVAPTGTAAAAPPKTTFQAPIPALSSTDTSAKGNHKTTPTTMVVPATTLQQRPVAPPSVNAPPGIKTAPSSEVPDFLSGFEKVSGEQQQQQQQGDQRPPWMMPGAPLLGGFEGSGVPLQCSPPLTSKSFDDLHRMLGSDLSPRPFDLNNSSKTYPTEGEVASHTTVANPLATQAQPAVANSVAAPSLAPVASKNPADAYAAFAQQSALAVSQHAAYGRSDSKPSTEAGVAATRSVATHATVPGMSSSLAETGHPTPSASVVSHANLRAHATQQRKLQDQTVGAASKPKSSGETTFPTSTSRLVSGSERSSEVSSTEDASSMHGSSSSNNGTSETGSNDSDSASDEGPPRKKAKSGAENVNRNATRDVISPVSSDRSSPQ